MLWFTMILQNFYRGFLAALYMDYYVQQLNIFSKSMANMKNF